MAKAPITPPVTEPGFALFVGKVAPDWHLSLADFENYIAFSGTTVVVPKLENPRVPNSFVEASLTHKDADQDALRLQFRDAWYARLHFEGAKADLRPYLAEGVVSFDLMVSDLAQGGLAFKISCGEHCERQVPYLIPGRALQGKGWQHLVFSMSCFVHDGDDFSAVVQPFAIETSGTGDVSVANIRFSPNGVANASCPDYKTMSVTPDMLNESWSINWWNDRHLQKLQMVKQQLAAHQGPQVIFLGDSITHNWEKDGFNVWNRYYQKYHAIGLGFGGDRTENLLWRLQHGEVDGTNPKVAVVMIGTNNTGSRNENPVTTAAGIKRNIEELQQRLPHTKILLLAIFPREEKPDSYLRQLNNQVNDIIMHYADNKRVFFLDIGYAFLDKQGVLSRDIMPDLLHPNETGYEIWAKTMQPELQHLMRMQ